jgi:hypothetical protein
MPKRDMKEGFMPFKRESREVENENRDNVEKSVSILLTVLRYIPRMLIYLCIALQLPYVTFCGVVVFGNLDWFVA